jgi:hypothetical protein
MGTHSLQNYSYVSVAKKREICKYTRNVTALTHSINSLKYL